MHNSSNTESLFFKVNHCGNKFLLAVVYLLPDPWSVTRDFYSLLRMLLPQTDNKLLVFGEFHLRNVVWNNDPLEHAFTAYLSPELIDSADRVFETFSMLGASQLYSNHPSKGYSLDLLFSSPAFVVNCYYDVLCLEIDIMSRNTLMCC